MFLTNLVLPVLLAFPWSAEISTTKGYRFDFIQFAESAGRSGHLALLNPEASRIYEGSIQLMESHQVLHLSGIYPTEWNWAAYSITDWGRPGWLRVLLCGNGNGGYLALTVVAKGFSAEYRTGFENRWRGWYEGGVAPITHVSILVPGRSHLKWRLRLGMLLHGIVGFGPDGLGVPVSNFPEPEVTVYFPAAGFRVKLNANEVNLAAAF